MQTRLKLAIALAASLLALAAVPVAGANGGFLNATLHVVHGIPGVKVDVCAGPAGGTLAPVIRNFEFTQIRTLSLPEGSYDVSVVLAGQSCTDGIPGLVTKNVFLPSRANASVVASLKPSGGFQLVVGVNDTSRATYPANSRVTVYHAAAAPSVDILAATRGSGFGPLLSGLSNGQTADADVPPAAYRIAVVPAGGDPSSAVATANLFAPRQVNTIVYAVGSLADGSFTLLTQRIGLSR